MAWPLLWTRGASSLTTAATRQQEQLHGQETDEVIRVGEVDRDRLGFLRDRVGDLGGQEAD